MPTSSPTRSGVATHRSRCPTASSGPGSGCRGCWSCSRRRAIPSTIFAPGHSLETWPEPPGRSWRRPRDRRPRLVPRGLRGALDRRAAGDPPAVGRCDRGADRRAAGWLPGAVLVARAADAGARPGGGVPLRQLAHGRRLPAASGPLRRSAFAGRRDALGRRERPGRGAGVLGARRLAAVRAAATAATGSRAVTGPRDLDRGAALRVRARAGRAAHGHGASRVHRPGSPDGDARDVHHGGEGAAGVTFERLDRVVERWRGASA